MILHKITMNIVSMVIDKNDYQEQKPEFYGNIFGERSYLHIIIVNTVSVGVHRVDI